MRADVVTLGADKDNAIINGANVNNSNGGAPAFFSGTDGNSAIHRALISFDFSTIPAGSTITDVRLTLTLGQVASGGATTATIGLFGVTKNWGEGTANSGIAGIAGSGAGVAAGAGDATWNAAAFPGTLWATPGGDHAVAASASLFLPNNTVNNSFTWLSTPQSVADVQGWLDNPATNFGWELINGNEVTAKTIYGFYSREWSNLHFGGNASQVPALQVTFTAPVPEPSAFLLMGVAGFSLLTLRRRA